jgi:hypothetical protein
VSGDDYLRYSEQRIVMQSTLSQSIGENWRQLYVAAVMEADRAKLPMCIAEAERALVVRARELFGSPGNHIEEAQALDQTMYALHALRKARHCERVSHFRVTAA